MLLDGHEVAVDLSMLTVAQAGKFDRTDDPWLPFRLLDPSGLPVEAVADYFRDPLAAGRAEATLRSYGMDLLRWFRFLWTVEVAWNRASRTEARDFSRWMLLAGKPRRPHWRTPNETPTAPETAQIYSPSVRAHSETVLRNFYGFHLEAGTGPVINPFPLDRARRGRGGRPNAHHNPMEPFRNERTGFISRPFPRGFRGASPMLSSMRSSLGCRRTGIGHWWPSMCRRARGRRNCCPSPKVMSSRGGS